MKNEIVVVTALFPPEPVVSANLSLDIARSLAHTNKVVVLAPKPSRPSGTNFPPTRDSYPFTKITVNSFVFPKSKIWGRLKESYSFGIHTSEYIKTNNKKIKAIYANTWPLFGQYFLAKAAVKYNIPLILHVQDIYPESLVKKLPAFLGKILYALCVPLDIFTLSRASKIIGISPDMITHLSMTRKVSKDKFVLIRNWQNDDNFRQTEEKPAEPSFTFMYLGNISASAGVEILINAFHHAGIPNSKLIIAGDGADKKKCQSLAKSLQSSQVFFLQAPIDQVPILQSQAHVLLLPLRKGVALTATPSKLTAYMLSGRPVLACVETASDAGQIILNCEGGFVTTPGSVPELSNMMRRSSEIPRNELLKMGRNARQFALSNLSREANLSKLRSLVESIANGDQTN